MYEHDPLTHTIIGSAIEVHRHFGPGLFESSYEEALCIELTDAKLPFTRQIRVPVLYKGHIIGEHRPDLVVSDRVLVEISRAWMPSTPYIERKPWPTCACCNYRLDY